MGSIASGVAPATASICSARFAQGECCASLGPGAPHNLVPAWPKPRVFPFKQHTQTFASSNLDKQWSRSCGLLKCRLAATLVEVIGTLPASGYLSFSGRSSNAHRSRCTRDSAQQIMMTITELLDAEQFCAEGCHSETDDWPSKVQPCGRAGEMIDMQEPRCSIRASASHRGRQRERSHRTTITQFIEQQ